MVQDGMFVVSFSGPVRGVSVSMAMTVATIIKCKSEDMRDHFQAT